jgi:hypothetical protein
MPLTSNTLIRRIKGLSLSVWSVIVVRSSLEKMSAKVCIEKASERLPYG